MLGIGYLELGKRNLCWMLSRVAYKIIKQPRLFTDVVVKTWPIESKRVEFDRDYAVYSTEGELLIVGSSQWIILDVSDRSAPSIIPARRFEMNLDSYVTERSMERPFPRIAPSFETDSAPYTVMPAYTDIDTNCHVNNIKYSNFVLNSLDLPYEKEITSFRLDFIKEIRTSTPVTLSHKKEDNVYLCRGESVSAAAERITNFIAHLEIK